MFGPRPESRSVRQRTALNAITDTTEPVAGVEEKPEPELKSDVGVDYAPFRDLLKAGEWRLADDEHRRLMCVLAGEDAEDRGWVYFTEARAFPVTDLKTIDTLWTFYSNGKFGFSVQRKIWVGQRRQWLKMFRQINWTNDQENECYRKFPEEYIWSIDAAKGHMPLTNALRGTQLLEALLEHPAFAPPKKVKSQAELATESAQETFTEVTKKAEDVMGNVMKGLKGLKKPSWMK